MADANAAKNAAPAPSSGGTPSPGGPKPFLLIAMMVVNMLFILGVGAMLYANKKKEEKEPKIDSVVKGEHETAEKEAKSKDFIGRVVPLETFLVNLAQSKGRKIAKVNIELEIDKAEGQEEIEKLKPKIRDIIILILSSKSYAQISTKEGKDALREEIKSQINLFITKSRISKVYFTEFIFSN